MLLDCVDILRSITKSCGDNVGGVNKRVWITQLQQIERYTFDSLGYVNSITTKEIGATNYGYELKKVISKKGSHSGNVEAIENVNVDVFKHTAILKAYATTPEQRDSLVSLYGASKVVVFFETDNGEIEIYGLENGLYATALTGNTGEQMQDDTAFTFTLSGLQTSLPKYFLYGGSLATSIAYLDEIGLNPIYVIQEYSAGISTITFTPDGSNGWDVEFLIAATLDAPIGVVVSSIDTKVRLYNISGETTLHTGTASATNVQFNTGANGAGIYELRTTYNLSNGDNFSIIRLISVDATDNILYEINSLGAVVNSVNGLSIDVSGQLTQVGVNYGVQWVAMDSLGNLLQLLGTTVDAVLALPIATSQVLMIIDLGAEFALYTGDPVTNIMVTIN